MLETYGLTECCSQAATAPLAAVARDTGAGVPLFCTRTEIAAEGRPALRSNGCAWRPGRGRSPAHRRPRAHRERGFLHVTGRKADTIVSGGENVAPSRGRGGARSMSRRNRGGGRGPPGRAVGRGRQRDRRHSPPKPTLSERAVRDHCAYAPGPVQGAKACDFCLSPPFLAPRLASRCEGSCNGIL